MKQAKTAVFVCSFSTGICDMKRAEQADALAVLRILVRDGRFSTFDASANPTIARTMSNMFHKSLTYQGKPYGPILKEDHEMGFPWTKVVLTEGGKQLLADFPSPTRIKETA